MPVALHLVNNCTSLVFVGTKGDALPSAAPLLIEVPDLTVGTLGVLFQSVVMFLALSVLMNKAGRRD